MADRSKGLVAGCMVIVWTATCCQSFDSGNGPSADVDSAQTSANDIGFDSEWDCYRRTETDEGETDGARAVAPKLVCVFDIDNTMTCMHSAEAVAACMDAGAKLAVNTAEAHDVALNNRAGTGYVNWAALGFPTNGITLDMSFSLFMFGLCLDDGSCSEAYGGAPGDCDRCNDCGPACPASYMGKAYGMYRIAKQYGVEPNHCLVLFDDLPVNTDTAQTFCYSAYNQGGCGSIWGWNNEGVYRQVYDYLTGDRFADCRP